MNYLAGDLIIRIKNTLLNRGHEVVGPKTKYLWDVAKALERLGYVEKVATEQGEIKLSLVYRHKEPLLTNLKLVSKPGLRVYKSAEDLRSYRGPATFLISTPKGVLSLSEATKQNLGGEVIVEII